ncbi:MAG TPA: 3-dehydroquinate synthase [Chlamydiales bacterium]|nr:3-dehydroquinate synthase [Chlamydiales bacterium]
MEKMEEGLVSLAKYCRGRVAVLSDATVAKSYGKEIQARLLKGGVEAELFAFPAGEGAKTRETKEFLEDELMRQNYGRDTVLIALGGGVTTDLVGFVAATYMRGVPFLSIPTTLLAMVDSAIGGKTGVNTPYGKNLIGAFYPPQAIFIHREFLKSLPEREWMSGLGEVLKYGLIGNRDHWQLCREAGKEWRKSPYIEKLIQGSIQTKIEVVEKDPTEKGYRRILNFGHTVGHALELLSGYEMAHGEAVAIGCMAESYLSYLVGSLSKEALEEILHLYNRLGFKVRLPKKFQKKSFLEAMALDKKGKSGSPRFVQIDQIGRCIPFDGDYCQGVEMYELEDLVSWMESHE